MFVKALNYEEPSYFVYGEDNKPDLLRMGVNGPYNAILSHYVILVNYSWAVYNWLRKSNNLDIGNIGKRSRHLNTKHGGNNKNSGSSVSRNALRWQKSRSIITKRYFCDKKGVRNESFNEYKPSGILDLKKLDELFLIPNKQVVKDIMSNIKDKDVLKAAYAKVTESSGVSYGSIPKIDQDYFENLSRELGTGSYKCKPIKRIYLKKPNGKLRPISIPCFKDKIVQEAIRLVLDVIFEHDFSDNSHGFRRNRSTHTALKQIHNQFTAVNWFIEGDISACFDNFDHKLILNFLAERIDDSLFFQTMHKLLKAGYIYRGSITKQIKGVPQGSILSPLLSNIYLNKLDLIMSDIKMLFDTDNSRKRKINPIYVKAIKEKNYNLIYNTSPYLNKDENSKRIWYVRYADDFLIGIIGSKVDAIWIKDRISDFLNIINLELNNGKILITHATTGKAYYLGYYIGITLQRRKQIVKVERQGKSYNMRINTRPQLLAPIPKLIKKLKDNGFVKQKNRSMFGTAKNLYILYDLNTIINTYKTLWLGILNYYNLANNISKLHCVHFILWTSCALTIAKKMKLRTISKVIDKYGKNLRVNKGFEFPLKISLKRNKLIYNKYIPEVNIDLWLERYLKRYKRTNTLLNKGCVICGSTQNISIHHINKLSNIKKKDLWSILHSAHKRKQIPVCSDCHYKIHKGLYTGTNLSKF